MIRRLAGFTCATGYALSLWAADPAPGSFVLTDYLNRSWSNECVEFPLSATQAADIASGKALTGPDGQPVPFQVYTGETVRVAFLVDLAPFETRAYRFTNATPSVQTDLTVEDTPERIRLSNGQTGISIRKTLGAGQGPIEKIRLQSGNWVGDSRLAATPAATGYSVRVVSQGPVFVEALCRAEFGGGSRWELRLRLNAREPVVLVDETMTLGEKTGVFSLSLNDDFAPDKVFFRDGKNAIGKNIVTNILTGNVFILEPWLRWWNQPAEGPVFSVYKNDGTDLLAVGAGEAGVWVDPAMPVGDRAAPYAAAVQDGQGLHLDFVLRNGKRKWMVMALDKATCLAAMEGPSWPYITPLPHRLVIKHGQFPLNTVKEYPLEWSGDHTNYPRLFLTRAQADEFRASVTNPAFYHNQIPGFLADPTPLNQHTIGGRIVAYMATTNRPLEQKLTDQAVEMLQQSVETFLTQPDIPFGSAPHNHWGQFMGATPQLVDAILGGQAITSGQRRRILAQLAFISYTINRPDYWSPERGYAANPNMTTSVLGYRMAYACVIPSHLQSHGWADSAVAGLREQLFGWSDSNGGWLEAPHYAMVSFDPILASFMMAYRAGMNETIYDPHMKKIAGWFAKLSTPPDSRIKGWRHLPPIGNTYISEPTGEFGLLAFIWKDRDPVFAAEMQWMFRRQGSWPEPGIGGSYPGFAGYRAMMRDTDLPETAPHYESEQFPNVGVMLRGPFPADRETQMLLLAGSFDGYRSHWDDDSGSITLWGKGRIVADDFGYYGAAPFEDHSMLDAPASRQSSIFNVTAFAPSGHLDYVRGVRGTWQRQIAFVKDDDPLAPNYFVLCDTLPEPQAATWRLWLTCTNVALSPQRARVEGKEDVDTDIFFTLPAGVGLTTEVKARTAGCGLDANGYQKTITTTQTGLIATRDAASVFTALIHPRLKTETPPVFTSLADGRVIKVESAVGIDYVFLSAQPFIFKDGDIFFGGTAGSIQLRAGHTNLSLGAVGYISAGGETLKSGIPDGLNAWTGFGNDTNWMTADNWSLSHAPTNGEDVVIDGAAVNLTNDTAILNSLVLTNGAILSAYSPATNGATPWGLLVSVSGTVSMAGNAWIYPYSHPTNGGSVWFRCVDLVVGTASGFDASGKGYRDLVSSGYGPGVGPGGSAQGLAGTGGGGYGGKGGDGGYIIDVNSKVGGIAYGSHTNPVAPGSSGARSNGKGGAGGGLIRVLADNSVLMDGSLLADGVAGTGYSGSGSGGGIYIQCKTFKGSGLLKAAGGDNVYIHYNGRNGGSGGGGRIAVVYDTIAQAAVSPQPTVTFNAAGGNRKVANSMNVLLVRLARGYPGSLYLSDTRFFDLAGVQGGAIMVPGVTSWSPVTLTLTNGLIAFPTGFSLTVSQNVNLTGAGGIDLSNSVVSIGGDLIINSDERGAVYFRGGPNQWIGIGTNLSLSKGWLEVDYQGTTNRSLNVPGNVTLNGALLYDYAHPTNASTLTVGGHMSATNGSLVYLYSGATNGLRGYGLLVDVAGEMKIGPACWLYPYSHNTNGGSVHFRVANLTVSTNAGIDASGKGFAGAFLTTYSPGYGPSRSPKGSSDCTPGAGYGGQGGSNVSSSTGPALTGGGRTYGSSNAPACPGSGGGSSQNLTSGRGSYGGGLIHVVAGSTVIVDGSLLADGETRNGYGGAGSGGGIFINCREFKGSGTGLLRANGGTNQGGQNISGSGGGGGGRIAVWYSKPLSSWLGAARVNGGLGRYTGYGQEGANGTVVLLQKPSTGTRIMVK